MASWPSAGEDRWEQRMLLGLLLAGSLVAAVWLVRLLLPWLLLGGIGVIALGIWQRHRQRDRLRHTVFYDLIQRRGGRISALDFAITAQLTGQEARRFLDARAKEFCGNFEPTHQGDVLYTFDVRDFADAQPPVQPPDGWRSPSTLIPDPLEATSDSSLSLADLAARLGCSVTLLQQRKWAADFAYWSQERDPEGWAWRIDPLGDRGYRLDSGRWGGEAVRR